MRWLIALMAGMLIGAMCTAMLIRVLSMGSAHARASMIVLAHHNQALHQLVGDPECGGDSAREHWRQVASSAREIPHAFVRLHDQDPEFRRRATQFIAMTQAPLADPLDCRALSERLEQLARGCRGCHREFR